MTPRTVLAAIAAIAFATTASAARFQVTNANDSGQGSFRWAIEQANATPGYDSIRATCPGPCLVMLASPLPEITDTVGIEAPITIDGSQAGVTDGIVISGAEVQISRIRVQNFAGDGFVMRGRAAYGEWLEATNNTNGIRIAGRAPACSARGSSRTGSTASGSPGVRATCGSVTCPHLV